MADREQLNQYNKLGSKEWADRIFKKNVTADLSGAELKGNANFQSAELTGCNFSEITITLGNFSYAELFSSNFSGARISWIHFIKAELYSANFSDAKLEGCDFTDAFLRKANFKNADLSHANLSRIQALGADFRGAILTGACIKDWNVNSETKIDNTVDCEFIYLEENERERRPSDLNIKFKRGEFAKLVQKYIHTVDLIFSGGINWKAFLSSYQDIQVEYGKQNVSIQSIENKSNNTFVIRLSAPPKVNKGKIEELFWQRYKPILQAKDEQIALYGQVLGDQRKENTRLLTIIETMAIKEEESLNEIQIKILKFICQGTCSDWEISKSLNIDIELVRYYLEYFEDSKFIKAIKGFDHLADESYLTCTLTNKGKVAAKDPNNLIRESKSNNTTNFNAPVGSVGNQGNQTNVAGVNECDQNS